MLGAMRFLVLVLLCVLTVGFAESKSDKISTIKKEIEQNDLKIQTQKARQTVVLNDLVVLNRNLSVANSRLKRARHDLAYYQSRHRVVSQKLALSRAAYEAATSGLSTRLREIYKTQDFGFLEVLFSTKDLLSFFESSIWFEKILKADLVMLNGVKSDYDRLVSQQQRLDRHTARISNLKQDITQRLGDIRTKKTKKNRYFKQLSDQIAAFEKRNQELVESSRQMGVLIKRKRVSAIKGTGSFIKPAVGWISSRFGYRTHPIFKRRIFHGGIDFAAPSGYKIKSADHGAVIFAGRWGGYGNATIVDHGDKLTTVYAHQSRIIVKKGQNVVKGQLIGYVGSTGYSTGPHLHFEARKHGKPIDPMRFFVN